MNKSKAKRLRKELEHEQRAADRGHQATARRLRRPIVMPSSQLAELVGKPKPLSDVQKAVHFEPEA